MAFIIITLGLIAGMFDAAINELANTFFINEFKSKTIETNVKQMIKTNMDYIFIGSTILAIIILSILMIQTIVFPKRIGYYGITLNAIVFSQVL